MHEILKYWIPYLSDFYARTVLELFGFLNNEFKLEKPCVKIIFQTKPYGLIEIQPYSETVICKFFSKYSHKLCLNSLGSGAQAYLLGDKTIALEHNGKISASKQFSRKKMQENAKMLLKGNTL